MRAYLIFMMVALSVFSAEIFANDCPKKNLLLQLYKVNDASILSLMDDKYYLNADRIYVAQDGIYMITDHFGLLPLSNLICDRVGTYTVGVYYYYRCDDCGACYNSEPAECDVCDGTSFTYVDGLGED